MGAQSVYNSPSNYVSVHLKGQFDDTQRRWIEVMRDMLLCGRICAVLWVDDDSSLRERLVGLCVAGVDEVKITGRAQQAAQRSLQAAFAINQQENLGLRILP